jgi:predicted RNase H-like nuclease (RuvC/YqgF family)
MTLSANQASKEAGKTKKTILDAIKSKRMSASKNDKGHWEIDPAELFRVFPKTSVTPLPKTTTIPPIENHENRVTIAELEAEVKALKREVERTDIERERERENLSQHIEDMRKAMAQLTDQRVGQGARRWFGLLPAR